MPSICGAMRAKNIDVGAVARAANEFKEKLDLVVEELHRCQEEFVAVEDNLDRERRLLRCGRDALREERYACLYCAF